MIFQVIFAVIFRRKYPRNFRDKNEMNEYEWAQSTVQVADELVKTAGDNARWSSFGEGRGIGARRYISGISNSRYTPSIAKAS